jgi:hypothetical protein
MELSVYRGAKPDLVVAVNAVDTPLAGSYPAFALTRLPDA